MTNQEAFTTVVQHLRTQGAPSLDSKGNCFYRHPDGIRRCAVGVLIPDKWYNHNMEGAKVTIISLPPSLDGVSIQLLLTLQDYHDEEGRNRSQSIIPWARRMEQVYVNIARDYGLIVPPHPYKEDDNEKTSLLVVSNHTTMVPQEVSM